MLSYKDIDMELTLEFPKTLRHKGKQYKLYDREAFNNDSKKILETIAIGKKNGFESIIVSVSAPAPLDERISYFSGPCFLIYYRKKE